MLNLITCLALAAPAGEVEVSEAEVGATDKDVLKAERLYEDAHYEKALKALKKGCEEAADPVRCERIKAFIQIALGDAFAARAAFDRMLVFDQDASLGPDVSPKLAGMFADAKRAMLDVKAMRLEPLTAPLEAGKPIRLEVKNPSNSMVELLTAYVAAPGVETFEAMELFVEGEVWSGSWVLTAPPGAGAARYYLRATLAGDVEVPIGADTASFELTPPGGSAAPPDDALPVEPLPPPAEEKGLPSWAPWVIAAGAVIVVGGGLGLGLGLGLGGQAPPPGAVQVNVVFYE